MFLIFLYFFFLFSNYHILFLPHTLFLFVEEGLYFLYFNYITICNIYIYTILHVFSYFGFLFMFVSFLICTIFHSFLLIFLIPVFLLFHFSNNYVFFLAPSNFADISVGLFAHIVDCLRCSYFFWPSAAKAILDP